MFTAKQEYPISDVITSMDLASVNNDKKVVCLSELEFDTSSDILTIKFPDKSEFNCSENATKNLCQEAGIPYGYWRKIDNALQHENISKRLRDSNKERRFEVNNDLMMVRGLVPDSYSRISNSDMLAKMAHDTTYKIRPVREVFDREEYLASEYSSWRVLVNKTPSGTDKSDNYAGVYLRMSELGGFFTSYPILFREVCTNGMVVSKSVNDVNYRMTYRGLDRVVAQSVLSSVCDNWKKKSGNFKTTIEDLQKTRIKQKEMEPFLNEMSEKHGISKKFNNTILEAVEKQNITDMDNWSFINMVTEVAQASPETQQVKIETAIAQLYQLDKIYLN